MSFGRVGGSPITPPPPTGTGRFLQIGSMSETKDDSAVPSVLCLCAHSSTEALTCQACWPWGQLPSKTVLVHEMCPTEELASPQDKRTCPLYLSDWAHGLHPELFWGTLWNVSAYGHSQFSLGCPISSPSRTKVPSVTLEALCQRSGGWAAEGAVGPSGWSTPNSLG